MIKRIAQAVSIIFHPLFLFVFLLWLTYAMDPYSFRINNEQQIAVTMIMTVVILLVIPLITTMMMKGLGFIQSLSMEDPKERIGPLIACIICYVWHYINVYSNPDFPDSYLAISLGGCISLALVFFINNFSKISLHTTGAGGFLAGTVILLYFKFGLPIEFVIADQIWQVHPTLIMMIVLVISGSIGTSRLIARAHRPSDVYGGYLVGIISMLIASRIVI